MNQTRNLAPISVSTYNRLEHLKKTIQSLQENTLAKETVLYVFSDAPKKGDEEIVAKVRKYLHTIDGFKEVRIVEQKTNDIKKNMKDAREIPLGEFGKMIRMEDDNVTSPYFLQYMNDGLDFYESDKKIIGICGYSLPLKYPKTENKIYLSYFLAAWGFATWADRDFLKIVNYNDGYSEIMQDEKLYKKFKKIHPNLIQGLKRVYDGTLQAGDYNITFDMIKNDKYTIKPFQSFVHNIGCDGSGMHCGKSNRYENNSLNNSIIKFPDKLEYDYTFDKLWLKYSYKQNVIIKVLSLIKRTIKHIIKILKN